jgi:hypothetical protein
MQATATASPNNTTAIIAVVVILILCCLCCSSLAGAYYYYYYRRPVSMYNTGTTGIPTTPGYVPPVNPVPTVPKPSGYRTIIAPTEYGCPAQTYTAIASLPNGSNVWQGSLTTDDKRFLVYDQGQGKLYCCRDPNTCDYSKGGWFYGWNVNDPRLTYM